MRIIFFTDVYRPTVNGVVGSIDLFADEMRKHGHTVQIVCPKYNDDHGDEQNILRIQSIPFLLYKEYRLASVFSKTLFSHMRKNVYDVVHIHSPFAIGLLGIYYAKRYNLPVVYTAHTNYADYLHYVPGASKIITPEVTDKLAARFSNRIDLTIAPSEKIKQNLLKDGATQPVEVMATGIHLDQFTQGNEQNFRDKFNLMNDPLLLYLGRVTKEKNISFLLQSFSRVHADRPDIKLVIVGDGPYRSHIEKEVEESGLAGSVVFTGYLQGQDRLDAFAAGDIFCMTSKTETQGMALLEAAASKLPLAVISDRAYEYIAHEGYNAIVAPDDIEEYSSQVLALLNDPRRRVEYAHNSLKLSHQFSIAHQAKQLVELYEKCIHDKRVKIKEYT